MNEIGACELCGSKIVEYKFGLNKGLLAFLVALVRAGKPVHIGELKLTNSQYSNYPKATYWGLASSMAPENEEESLKGGKWALTLKRLQFLRGNQAIPKYAVTLKGAVVRHEGPDIYVDGIEEGYAYRGDYQAQARGQICNNTDQMDLL